MNGRKVPLYSDLLLHDMGPDLADGIVQGLASGSEFRTSPLWGVRYSAPYLHDGRATTLENAIAAHGGEAQDSRAAQPTIERRGLTTNATKVTQKRFKGVTAKIAASDHCPVAIEIKL